MNLKHYLIAITLCAPYLLSLLGCKNHQDANERDLLTIHIKDYENKTIPRPAVISNIDTIELDTHGYFMSDIKTVCISDTMAYVADRANTVWAFKYPSGDFVRRIRNVGHGNGEYASAWTLALGDSLLYVMDFESRSILAYDATLNYKSSFRYGFPALDFIKVKDGFLFLNLSATDNLHRVVHTNDRGEVQQSYLPSEMSLDMIYNEISFVRDKNGEVYIFPPFSNAIYRWTSEGPKPVFRTDFGKNAAEEDVKSSYDITESGKAFNTGFFIVDNHLVNRFFHSEKNYFSIYDMEKGIQHIVTTDTTEVIPFAPQWQSANGLIGNILTTDYDKWRPQKDSCDAALFVFHLK